MIDLNEISIDYTIKTRKGRPITFKLIYFETLVNLAGLDECSIYDYEFYEKSIRENITGLVENPYDVTWYAAPTYALDMVEAIKMAVREGNRIIIIEYTDI